MPDNDLVSLEEDAFVKAINDKVADPEDKLTDPEESLLMFGFITIRDGKVRAYTDSRMSAHVEFDHADVIYAQKAPTSISPIGGSFIWVRRDAACTYNRQRMSITSELGMAERDILDQIMEKIEIRNPLEDPNRGFPVKRPVQAGMSPQCCKVSNGRDNESLPGGVTYNPLQYTCGYTCVPPCFSVVNCVPDKLRGFPLGKKDGLW